MSRKYTKEFKEEAVKLVTEHGYTQTEAALQLGISDKNIHRWVRERTHEIKPFKELTEDQREIRRLQKEVDRLKMEKEILKKAAAFFANESK
jgi:transposase